MIAAHGHVIGGHVTGGPDLGQEDVRALQEEDQGIGNCLEFCVPCLFGYSHLTTLCQPCYWGRFLFLSLKYLSLFEHRTTREKDKTFSFLKESTLKTVLIFKLICWAFNPLNICDYKSSLNRNVWFCTELLVSRLVPCYLSYKLVLQINLLTVMPMP